MATKTFEELKQLAIQIRDEKTNKANTATRIGTQMIEHLNKLEQEYYTIQTVDGLVSEYNVSVNHPTSGIDGSNKYTLSSAIALVPEQYRTIGIKCSFINEAGQSESWEYQGNTWNKNNFAKSGYKKIFDLEFASKYDNERNISGLNVQRTENLFVKEAFLPYTINEKGVISTSDTYAICKIKVEAGKTYYRYDGITKSTWYSTNCRLFDDTGFLGVFSGTDIEIPSSSQNPYIYLTIPQGKGDKFMFTENPFVSKYIPSTDYLRIKTLETNTVKKTVERTENLFNYQDKTYEGKTISDLGVWSASSTFNTVSIEVEAGKTYKRYSKAGNLNSWGSTNIRVFDKGIMVLKDNGTDFTVPEDAVNPIAYVAYYIDYASHGQTAPSLYMILESTVSGDTQIPYYNVEFEQNLVDYIKEQIKDTDLTNSIVQGTGQSTDKAMSQKSVTDSLNEQKNSLQTAILNAVAGLTSSQIEQGTGQSTTSTMSQKSISDALAVLAEGITGDIQYRFAGRPASGYENFLVDVDVNIATTNLDTEAVADSINLQKDRCILALPTNYSRSGKPTRLVICGHGTGWKCTASTTIPWAGMNTQLLLDEGYAVLGCNGTPGDLDGLDQGHNGTPQCYRSILAAYKYVTGKYNIATNGVLTAGLSMGTIMTTQITCFADIPVLAQVVFSPSFELMKSQFTLKPAVRQRMCEKFGFVGQAPTFTSQDPPSEAEKQYVLDNFDKWCGYDTIINGISGGAKETFSVWPNHAVKENAAEKALYQDKAIIRRVPIKMFVCDDDTVASPRWADYLSIMMRNGGCYCEVRHYATGGHNAWGAGNDVEVNTLLGGTKTVNGASYEGLLFLKRFDL